MNQGMQLKNRLEGPQCLCSAVIYNKVNNVGQATVILMQHNQLIQPDDACFQLSRLYDQKRAWDDMQDGSEEPPAPAEERPLKKAAVECVHLLPRSTCFWSCFEALKQFDGMQRGQQEAGQARRSNIGGCTHAEKARGGANSPTEEANRALYGATFSDLPADALELIRDHLEQGDRLLFSRVDRNRICVGGFLDGTGHA
ncbi:hypothetical protein WJX82_004522 [Trebouxia sp. C0006]